MKRRTLIMCVIGMVLVVVIGAVVTLIATRRGDSSSTPASATSVAGVPPVDVGGGFGVPTTDYLGRKLLVPVNPGGQPLAQVDPGQRVTTCAAGQPVSAPVGAQIEQLGNGSKSWFSTSDGPTRVDGLIALGYADTPQGAALAATTVAAAIAAGGPAYSQMLAKMALATPAQKSTLATADPGPGMAPEYMTGFFAAQAFRVLTCDPSFAAVEIATPLPFDDQGQRVSQPRWMGVRLNFTWHGGDWKLLAAPEGSGTVYTDLSGWTLWQT